LATILNINTAFENASVSISRNGKTFAARENNSQKDHASFLQPAIKDLCESAKISLTDISAVSVINGPGSYTGLRVGLSSAKALCYALNTPLILLNSLEVMALAIKNQSALQQDGILFCPMIDARRMEVFTGLYNSKLEPVNPEASVIIDLKFLEKEQADHQIFTGGSGSRKFHEITKFDHIHDINPLFLTEPAAILSEKAFLSENFSDVAYSEPYYLKQVYFKNQQV
jgi:tRNA threonylcarbamoyladenosine biosynthesis protein TsaB